MLRGVSTSSDSPHRVARAPGRGVVAGALASLCLAACAAFAPVTIVPGQAEADVVRALGPVTARYAMPDGTTRVEIARGPLGRQTYMIDVDAAGRVLRGEQVLDERHFAEIVDGMTEAQVLRRIGRPAERQPVGFVGRVVWSWRYENNLCLWFRVTFGPDGRTIGGGGYLPDPLCEPPFEPF